MATKRLEVPPPQRRCGTCHVVKPSDAFNRSRQTKDGLHPRCKACRSEARRAARAADPEGERAKYRERYARDRDKIRAKQAEYYRRNADEFNTSGREMYLLRTFGITVAGYEALHVAQGGACAICGEPESRTDHRTGRPCRLAVDHDHATGRVRGLLCRKCNTAVGLLGDSVGGIERALAYLKRGEG
jgi:hypothetical protein